jgi:hypothetical protein
MTTGVDVGNGIDVTLGVALGVLVGTTRVVGVGGAGVTVVVCLAVGVGTQP